ncbi:MAG: response regulator transcription factor, partial [Prevotella sp.]|nr:response regulator transcription factor [Prevotella sp.]
DLVILDVMMPGMSGFEFAKLLTTPIIFLTAMDTEDSIVAGLKLGADDYIAKPFSPNILKARVAAVLRRTNEKSQKSRPIRSKNIEFEGIVVNTQQMTLSIDGEPIASTRRELDLLIMLISNADKVFSREDILMKVWPDDVCVTVRTVDVYITRIRKKLGKYSNHIHTRVGYGYCFRS